MKSSNNPNSFNILAVLLIVVLFIVAWKLILPSYAADKDQISILDQEIDQATAKKEALDQARTDLSSAEAAYKAITVSVSEDNDEPNTISELEAIALKNGITIPNIGISEGISDLATPVDDSSSVSSVTAGQEISISLSVMGTFEQLNGFITSLEKSVKFMNIKSITLNQGENNNLSMSLGISAYSRTRPTADTTIDASSGSSATVQ